MNTQERIGRVTKTLRVRKGLSQEQFCSQCGTDQHYISNIENGQRNLSVDVVERIANFFGMTISQFFVYVETYEEPKPKASRSTMIVGQEGFVHYMQKIKLSERTIKKYSSDVPNCKGVKDIIQEVTGITDDMYHVSNLDYLRRVIAMVSESSFDQIGNNMYSCGLKKYLQYLQSLQ